MTDFQREVARIALTAASPHGFALGGGQALVVHGVVSRPTEDIDLFADTDGAVRAATSLVQEALSNVGLEVAAMPEDSDLGDMFDGFQDDFLTPHSTPGSNPVGWPTCGLDSTAGRVGPQAIHLEDS